jgi:uncharacterized protein YjbI with pentapeptide repeats
VADKKAVKRLKQGVAEWNAWRNAHPDDPDARRATLNRVDLRGANLSSISERNTLPRPSTLSGADLHDVDLIGVNLSATSLVQANLSGAYLHDANLSAGSTSPFSRVTGTDLSGANLSDAYLGRANLSGAYLTGTDLSGANLTGANLTDASLRYANLTGAELSGTVFGNADLTGVIGLETCRHRGPSTIDHRTLQISGPLPLSFLRGVGLPDRLIDYLPSLLDQAIQHYSCFISYSTKDQEFAERLHADLQDKGVRCWFAPHDLRIGKKSLDEIDAAIRLRDRVLLILSEHAINSDWVEDEVTAGFEEERKRGEEVLFPVRLDEMVLNTKEAWASKLRARLIGDFTRWKDHDAYKQSFERAVRDLTVPPAK